MTCTEKLNIRPRHCSLPALTRGQLKMSLCHRGHTTKIHNSDESSTRRKTQHNAEFLAEPFSKICFQLFLCFLTEKVIIAVGHSIMKTGKLERAPHCLLFRKFHPCFSRTCLTTPSHSHLRETAGL